MEIATPYYNIISDAAPKALQVADSQVAGAIAFLQNTENAKAFVAARDDYLKYVESSIEKVKTSTKVDERLASLITGLQGAVNNVRSTSWGAYSASLERLNSAWTQFVQHPQVQGTLGKGGEMSKELLKKYEQAHNVVVSDPKYALLVAKTNDLANFLGNSYPYKVVAPYAEPLIDKAKTTEVYKQAVQQLQPKASPAPGMSPSVATTTPASSAPAS